MGEVADTLAKGASIYAKVSSVFFFLVVIFIDVLLIWWATSIQKDPQSSHTPGVITYVKDCREQLGRESRTFYCAVEVSYVVGGVTYKNTFDYSGSIRPSLNSRVDIKYMPSDPTNASIDTNPNPYVLWAIAIVLFLFALVSMILTFTYESYATFTGAVGGMSTIASSFGGGGDMF